MKSKNFFELKHKKMTPGEVVKAFRKNFRITQKELEEVTGIVESNISAIENNRVEIGLRRAVLLGTALGIDPSFILFPNGVADLGNDKEILAVKRAAAKLIRKKKKAS